MPRTEDLARVRAVLETDRKWSVFALADLAPEYSKHSEWHVAEHNTALLLVYRGFNPPVLLAVGSAKDIAPLLPEVVGEAEFYLAVPPDVFDLMQNAGYEMRDVKTMIRMVLDRNHCRRGETGSAVRLGVNDRDPLVRLYEDGKATGEAPAFFRDSMLRNGVYFGIREGEELVAAAGTLVVAPQQSVAALGNIYTRRDRRCRGFGSLATASVTTELLQQDVQIIALNVATDNRAAIRVYQQLGFTPYCEYREAIAVRKAG